jgi:acetylglutamate/LysW-gamma-L-alpha-aminoadipate kinase
MIVVKAGGNGKLDMDLICADVAAVAHQGQQILLVHGGSHETNVISEKLGHPPRFVTSVSGHVSRYTDRQTLEIFAMVTAGRINKLLVESLQKRDVNAIGLSGLDGRLVQAKRKPALRIVENGKRKILRGDFSGRIDGVNANLLEALLAAGTVPVIAPLAVSHEGDALNVDADRVAAAISSAVGADTLIILSDVPGLLKAYPDESTLIPYIRQEQAPAMLDRYAEGRMKKKVLGAVEALSDGVGRVIIADGRVDQPVQNALAGQGTLID